MVAVFRGMRIESGGVGIHYEVTGRGPARGAAPRLSRHGAAVAPPGPALAQAGFRVIVPDMRGYGRSDKPSSVEADAMQALD
jgi:pimeloyl-ACP methyl ester carboxylesterase